MAANTGCKLIQNALSRPCLPLTIRQRIRAVTSVIFEVTIGCEFITPFFPQHFLALASVANVGKAIALSAFVATQPALQQALCVGGNLADVTAKGQALVRVAVCGKGGVWGGKGGRGGEKSICLGADAASLSACMSKLETNMVSNSVRT